jgi:anti-sigma factor RsiW
MFDRCGRWQRKLQRRADGTLSERQWGALEAHLSQCAYCRATADADRALRESLYTHKGLLDARVAEAFDNQVISLVFRDPGARNQIPWRRLLSWRPSRGVGRALPLGFLSQIATGACAAATVTALCLTPALHPAAGHSGRRTPTASIAPALPPVPIESLLQTSSPCAALLWAAPHAHDAGSQGSPRPEMKLPPEPREKRPRQEVPSIRNNMG